VVVQRQIFNGKYSLFFDHDGARIEYELEVVEGKVIREIFTVDGENRLDRKACGEGLILAVKGDYSLLTGFEYGCRGAFGVSGWPP
jgi:hypothetical protein